MHKDQKVCRSVNFMVAEGGLDVIKYRSVNWREPMTVKEIGEIVRKSRKEQNLTQPQLAMACGTGVRFIVDLEAGKETCQIGKVLNVIQMLGLKVSVDQR